MSHLNLKVWQCIFCVISSISLAHSSLLYADEPVEFNTDILNLEDRNNIDLSRFSKEDYIYPGIYEVSIFINEDLIEHNYKIKFIKSSNNDNETLACIPREVVEKFSLQEPYLKGLTWWGNEQCLNRDSLPSMTVKPQLKKSKLFITVPQAYLSYTAQGWDPPSRWDEGISGALFDYHLTAQDIKRKSESSHQFSLNGQGTMGLNIDAWRLRADWQSVYDNNDAEDKSFDWKWAQIYAYRSIKPLNAKLALGENYSSSDLFENIRYMGITLSSEDNMLPPNLRGYAPQISGVASSNAKVIISQQGRVIYETTVSQGPFAIQDINESISGVLDVRVEEDNGKIQEFQVNTSSVPYLTRPGQIRYKTLIGKPSDVDRNRKGPMFGMGEFSWGINNGWSLFGGAIVSDEYNSFSAGIGRDLLTFGAVSVDMTTSFAKNVNNQNDDKQGNAYRINYSKRFEEFNNQVTLAGYRFAEQDFLTLNQYIDGKYYNREVNKDKDLYLLTFSQSFPDFGLNAYLSYSHRTYWNSEKSDYFSFSLSKYFNVASFKNNSININAYRNNTYGRSDNGFFINLSIPLDTKTTISMNSYINSGDIANTVSYNKTVDDRNNYNISGGTTARGRANVSGYYRHYADSAVVSGSASYTDSVSSVATLSIDGGATLTPKGGALHRINIPGSSRILLDTDGVKNVPISGNGPNTTTNYFGKAILPLGSDYMRSRVSVNIDDLPSNIEAKGSIQQITLTEGAIGYRKFNVSEGAKIIAKIMLKDGSFAPFGSTILNESNQDMGMVSDNGSAYLGGVKSHEILFIQLSENNVCKIELPDLSAKGNYTSILLTCD
jgi:outer membrane usher protein PapC